MSAHMKFGEVLHTARERKGIDLSTAARRLRIRPDILSAIEASDISRMPPRGYSRNMVNAYARMLGLNPTEITKLYLDEAYAYQVGRARDDARVIGSGVSVASTRREARRQTRGEDPTIGDGRTSALGRRQYSDARTSQYYSDPAPEPTTRRSRFSSDRTHPSRGTALPNAHYTNFYAGPTAPNAIRSKLPFIIGAAVILILLIIVLVLAFGGNRGGGSTDDVTTVPITGIDDPEAGSQTTDENGTTTPSTPVAPTSVEVVYEVADGAAPWVTVTENGSEMLVNEVVSGPTSETIDVTGTLTIGTPQPGNVTVTVDGEAVELTDDDGDGTYTVTIDFNSYLAAWREENGVTGTTGNSGTGTAANGTTGSDTSGATGTNTTNTSGTTTGNTTTTNTSTNTTTNTTA